MKLQEQEDRSIDFDDMIENDKEVEFRNYLFNFRW